MDLFVENGFDVVRVKLGFDGHVFHVAHGVGATTGLENFEPFDVFQFITITTPIPFTATTLLGLVGRGIDMAALAKELGDIVLMKVRFRLRVVVRDIVGFVRAGHDLIEWVYLRIKF